MAYQGQPVIHRTASDEYHFAVIAGNIDGDEADLLTFENGDTWYTSNDINTTAIPHAAVSAGTGVGEWAAITEGLGLPDFTWAANSRVLGTPFQPSTTRPTLVCFSLRVLSAISVLGGQAGRIELRSDANATPSTVRARVAGGLTGTAVVGLALTDISEGTITYLVPPGDYVLFQSVNETGTPTYSITAQGEAIL